MTRRPASPRQLAERALERGLFSQRDLSQSVPAQLGRYEVLRPLGEGAHSVVYLAHDPLLGRRVAVKLLRGLKGSAARFQREMKILAALEHPNVVKILDAGLLGERPYYAMEYPGDATLADSELSLAGVVRVVEQAARACQAAHERGIVHRDLKPSNVLVADDGRAVVADFGVAKILDSAGVTRPGALVGTPPYMAPEQVAGDETVDARTDVYALGVILYQAATGRLPFEAERLMALVAQIVDGNPTPPRQLEPGTPPQLETIILRAMAAAPEDRHPSALDLAESLRGWLDGTAPRTAGESREAGAGTDRARLFAQIGGAALLVAVGAGLALVLSGPARDRALSESPASPTASPASPTQSSPPPQPDPGEAVATELARVEAWAEASRGPLPPIDTSELVTAESRLDVLLDASQGAVRQEALLARALARAGQGRLGAARSDLQEGIELGGPLTARLHFERALVGWPLPVLAGVLGEPEDARTKLLAIARDMLRALEGTLEPWREEVARTVAAGELPPVPGAGETGQARVAFLRGWLMVAAAPQEAKNGPLKTAAAKRGTAVDAEAGRLAASVNLIRQLEEQQSEALPLAMESLGQAADLVALQPRHEGSALVVAGFCHAFFVRMLGGGAPLTANPYVADSVARIRGQLRRVLDDRATPEIWIAYGNACVLQGGHSAPAERAELLEEGIASLRTAAQRGLEPRMSLVLAHLLRALCPEAATRRAEDLDAARGYLDEMPASAVQLTLRRGLAMVAGE